VFRLKRLKERERERKREKERHENGHNKVEVDIYECFEGLVSNNNIHK
jgi:hypothetical protein